MSVGKPSHAAVPGNEMLRTCTSMTRTLALFELALRVGQGLSLDQQTATLITTTISTEADDDCEPCAVCLGAG